VWDDILHILYVHGVGNDLAASSLVKLAQSHAFGFSPGLPKGAIVEDGAPAGIPQPGIPPPGIENGDVKEEDVKEEDEEEDGEADELAPAAAGVKWVREMDDQLRRGYMIFREWCRQQGVAASSKHRASPVSGHASDTHERGGQGISRHACPDHVWAPR
jgi:hypothetical protein